MTTSAAQGDARGRPSSDRTVAARILPVLGAAALGLVPFTVFSTLLVDIADALGVEPATVGGLRGLGGFAAVLVGVAYATLVQRLRSSTAVALALTLLAVFSFIGTIAALPATIAFCLGIGAATSILNPALQASAAARFELPADRGRAATMVTATTTLTAVLAAPVIGGLSLVLGRRGVLLVVGGMSLVLAVSMAWVSRGSAAVSRSRAHVSGDVRFLPRLRKHSPASASATSKPRASQALREVLMDRHARSLVAISCLRTAAFMGSLAVMAAVYAERHALGGGAFTAIWTVSGVSFFLGNWCSGRLLAATTRGSWLLAGGVSSALAGVVLVFAVAPLALMVTGTALLALGHAMIAAAVTSALASTPGDAGRAALAVNGVAQSVGTFAGAALASGGYAVAGWPGVALVLAAVTGGCGLLAWWGGRRGEATMSEGECRPPARESGAWSDRP